MNKRHYFDLFCSIFMASIFAISILSLLTITTVWFTIGPPDWDNAVYYGLLFITGVPSLLGGVFLLKNSFGYWYINELGLTNGCLFHKKKFVRYESIINVRIRCLYEEHLTKYPRKEVFVCFYYMNDKFVKIPLLDNLKPAIRNAISKTRINVEIDLDKTYDEYLQEENNRKS